MSVFPRWHTAITNAISEHKNQTILQLSTISLTSASQSASHVRSIAFRNFLAHPNNPAIPLIVATTDVRTPKVHQLKANPNVELAWWIEGTQEQFRISGKAYVFSAPEKSVSTLPQPFTESKINWEEERQEGFKKLSGFMKASWCRPTPGTPLNEHGGKEAAKKWPQKLPEQGEGTEEEEKQLKEALSNFALLVVDPSEVDFVELAKAPHKRTRFWLEEGSWSEEDLVP